MTIQIAQRISNMGMARMRPMTISIIFIGLSFYRSCKSLFDRPFLGVYSSLQSTLANAYFVSPIRHTMSFAIKGYHMIKSGVSSLFLFRSPSAIRLFIMSVYVYAVNRSLHYSKFLNMFFVRFIHIISKFFKRIPKTLNSSSTVNAIFRSFGVITPLFYSSESHIKSRIPHSVGSLSVAKHAFGITTARFGLTTPQFTSGRKTNFPTITKTFPFTLSKFGFAEVFQYFKSIKLFTSQILKKMLANCRSLFGGFISCYQYLFKFFAHLIKTAQTRKRLSGLISSVSLPASSSNNLILSYIQ